MAHFSVIEIGYDTRIRCILENVLKDGIHIATSQPEQTPKHIMDAIAPGDDITYHLGRNRVFTIGYEQFMAEQCEAAAKETNGSQHQITTDVQGSHKDS